MVKKNKIKGISKSQSKHKKFEDYYNFLFGGEYQKECDNYNIRSLIHEMYLQKVRKSTLSLFDDKRCYINETESILWNQKFILSSIPNLGVLFVYYHHCHYL